MFTMQSPSSAAYARKHQNKRQIFALLGMNYCIKAARQRKAQSSDTAANHAQRHQNILKEHLSFSDLQFHSHYRMRPPTFVKLLTHLRKPLQDAFPLSATASSALPNELRVLITLRYLAGGEMTHI